MNRQLKRRDTELTVTWAAAADQAPEAGIIHPLQQISGVSVMPKEFRTEADRLATPRPVPPKGVCFTAPRGQKRSLERGTATNNKKNPGKRPHQGG
jgi:hypothetical protein